MITIRISIIIIISIPLLSFVSPLLYVWFKPKPENGF